jgi:hypothetical protein
MLVIRGEIHLVEQLVRGEVHQNVSSTIPRFVTKGGGIEEATSSCPRDQANPLCCQHHDEIKHGKLTFQDPFSRAL